MLRNKSDVKCHLHTGLAAMGVVSYITFTSPTLAAIATFNTFSEGFSGTTITDGGITFFDLDERFSPARLPYTFSIESTTPEQLGSYFSTPNYLTTEGFVPGSEPSFGRFGSARITTGRVAQAASLELFSQLFSPLNNNLTLEASLNGNLVASNSVALADFEVIGTGPLLHQTLAVSSDVAFDELRLVASGPDDNGVAFIGIDNVRFVPEPTSALSVLAFGALGAGSLLKRKNKSV